MVRKQLAKVKFLPATLETQTPMVWPFVTTGEALPGQPNPARCSRFFGACSTTCRERFRQLRLVNAGTVTLAQNSLVFQIGSNAEQTSSLALRNMRTNSLGTGVENTSGFQSLADVDVTNAVKGSGFDASSGSSVGRSVLHTC